MLELSTKQSTCGSLATVPGSQETTAHSKALNLQYSLQATMAHVLQANNPKTLKDES